LALVITALAAGNRVMLAERADPGNVAADGHLISKACRRRVVRGAGGRGFVGSFVFAL
jgi:hypothetical protein